MSDVIIKIEDLSKQYRLGTVGTGTLSHDINRWWASLRGKEDPFLKIGEVNDRTKASDAEYVWALKDINVEIERGDIVGIIGKNGAGKSTLLKILSKVTRPTIGNIKLGGRIASLLEVGTGFHPEMTGRENIYLNGAILGMRKAEITQKFDEIVAFAGVERYVDTPVKRYSSGMYVRLAFSVAAHLEPEILVIDEVLAVGDAEFQKKCLGKMQDISRNDGRTVLFVSHNMAAIKTLCQKGIVLENGTNVFNGTQIDAIDYYQKQQDSLSSYVHSGEIHTALGNENIRILEFNVTAAKGSEFKISSGVKCKLIFYNHKQNINLAVGVELRTIDEFIVFHTGEVLTSQKDSKCGIYIVTFEIDANILNAGNYYFNLLFGENQRYILYRRDNIIGFEILNEAIGNNYATMPGVIRPQLNFETKFNHDFNNPFIE
jgi:lipopolysaccharide transport system ATP-binding protein